MSERGLVCAAMHCVHNCHHECHIDYCPRIDGAYRLLEECAKHLHESFCAVGSDYDEKFSQRIYAFLNEDKSYKEDIESRNKQEKSYSVCRLLDPKTCKPGSTYCSYFNRLGDDYGNCTKTGISCPVDGLVDISHLIPVEDLK